MVNMEGQQTKQQSREQSNEVSELKEFLNVTIHKKRKKEVAIISDGKQYTVRIPKSFADAIQIDPKSDAFIFQLLLPSPTAKESPKLTGELRRE